MLQVSGPKNNLVLKYPGCICKLFICRLKIMDELKKAKAFEPKISYIFGLYAILLKEITDTMQLHKLFLVYVFFFNSITCIAQQDPPPSAMPNIKKQNLIDTLIKASDYEVYFHARCVNAVSKSAEKNNWTTEKKNEITSSIDFKFVRSHVYNAFVLYSSEELKQLIQTLKSMANKDSYDKPVILTPMLENNFEVFIDGLIEGKYIMK